MTVKLVLTENTDPVYFSCLGVEKHLRSQLCSGLLFVEHVMLKFLSPAATQLTAAKSLLAHLAETCDIPASVRLWDGSCLPLGQRAEETGVTIAIRSPGVIGALLRRPTLDHFIRQYATGGIDFCGADLGPTDIPSRQKSVALRDCFELKEEFSHGSTT